MPKPLTMQDCHRAISADWLLTENLKHSAPASRRLGEDVSSLLGSLIVSKLALTSLSRENIPEAERVPHLLYIDEAGSFTAGIDLPTILSESRKYRLGLVIGAQAISQYPESTAAALFANVGSLITFRVSQEDAKTLVRQFAVSGEGLQTMEDTFIPASALQNLPDHTMFVQTLSNGAPREPIRVKAFAPFERADMQRLWERTARISDRERVLRQSDMRYGRDRSGVEAQLNRFLKVF
jgi:TraM recognition site of TraD and TraG